MGKSETALDLSRYSWRDVYDFIFFGVHYISVGSAVTLRYIAPHFCRLIGSNLFKGNH